MDEFLSNLGITRTGTLTTILRFAITVLLAMIFIAIVNGVTRRLTRNKTVKRNHSLVLLTRYALIAIIAVAAVMSLISGSAKEAVNKTLAGSGVVAVVLSIACQEPIGNLCSGVIIMLTQPFRIGDLVKYHDDDTMGVVEEITLRHTVLRTFENRRVIVPNSVMNKSAIENSNFKETRINLPIDFNITYDSDLDEAMGIISDVILMHPRFRDFRTDKQIASGDPIVDVYVREFKESAINIRAWVWADSSGASVSMKSDILIHTRRRFLDTGIKFAHPHIVVSTLNEGEDTLGDF